MEKDGNIDLTLDVINGILSGWAQVKHQERTQKHLRVIEKDFADWIA